MKSERLDLRRGLMASSIPSLGDSKGDWEKVSYKHRRASKLPTFTPFETLATHKTLLTYKASSPSLHTYITNPLLSSKSYFRQPPSSFYYKMPSQPNHSANKPQPYHAITTSSATHPPPHLTRPPPPLIRPPPTDPAPHPVQSRTYAQVASFPPRHIVRSSSRAPQNDNQRRELYALESEANRRLPK